MPRDDSADPRPRHLGAAALVRSRQLQWVTAGLMAVVAMVAASITLTAGDELTPATSPLTAATASATATEPAGEPSVRSTGAELAPGEIVIESGPDGIAVFAAAGDEEPAERLPPWTALGSPTTLMGFARDTIDGEEWIQVELIGAPNHRAGWVRAADAAVGSSNARIDVYLEEREVELAAGAEIAAVSDAVIGEDASPTPLGVFWVTDVLDFTANPTGVYGAYALGLNGWSETLDEFNGGPPQIAVHGTNQPALMGQAVSNGCVRLPNDVITAIAQADGVGVGTPVVIHASRQG